MTTPTVPAATTAIGTAAAAEPVESKVVVPVDGAKAPPAPVAAPVAGEKAPGAETPEAKAAAEKAIADKAALELGAKPFTDVAQLKIAEGQKLDEAIAKDFLALAKDQGFTAKQAQALLEYSNKGSAAAEAKREAARVEKFAAANKTAVETLRGDKEIGGAKYDASMALAGKALRNIPGGLEFGKQASQAELPDGSLLGNNVEFARFLVGLGKAIAEDSKAGTHSNGAAKSKTLTEQLYGPGTVAAGVGPTS